MKKVKHYLLFLSVFLFLFNIKTVHASEINSSNIVTKNKIWTIKFNKFVKLDPNTLSNISIKDSQNNTVPIKLQLDKSNKNILVLPPKEGYKDGQSYNLTISKNLKDVKGKLLKKDTNLKFTIKSTQTMDNTKLGNTIGNSINDSWVGEDENYLYFLCSESLDTSSIYKMNKTTSKTSKLHGEDELHYLNVLNNKIYYLKGEKKTDYNLKDNDDENQYINNIYVMDTNGENNKKILDDVFEYVVAGNHIYFTRIVDDFKLYRCDLDGSNKTKLTNEGVGLFNILGDKIIYNNIHGMYENFLSHGIYGNIFAMNLDGSNTKKLTNNEAFSLNSQNDGIYYINQSDNNKIYKVTLDGKNEKISDVPVDCININNGIIYYRNLSDTTTLAVKPHNQATKVPTLYKMNTNGRLNTKLSSKYCLNLNVLNNKLYYIEYYNDSPLRCLYKNGSSNDPLVWNYIVKSELP